MADSDEKLKNLFLLFILVILVFYIHIQSKISPYKKKYNILNKMEEGSFFSLSLSTAILLAHNFVSETKNFAGSSTDSNNSILINALLACLILINGTYYLIFVLLYLKYSKIKKKAIRFAKRKFTRALRNVQTLFKTWKSSSLPSGLQAISTKEEILSENQNEEEIEENEISDIDFISKISFQNESSNLLPYLKKKTKKIDDLNNKIFCLKKMLKNGKLDLGLKTNEVAKEVAERKNIRILILHEKNSQIIFEDNYLCVASKCITMNNQIIEYQISLQINQDNHNSELIVSLVLTEKAFNKSSVSN